MSAAKRRRDALRRKGPEPYATLRCEDLLSAACGLDPVALRLWLLLNANYVPPELTGRTGEAFVAYSQAKKMAGHGRSAIASAFRRLKELGLILLVREGHRPRAPGAAVPERQATVWDLLSRHPRERPKPPLPAGMERPRGKVRLNAYRIRADVKGLSPTATKVLAFAVAHRHRDKWGALAEDAAFPLPARLLARALGVSASTAAEAVRELADNGRLLRAEPPSGRRPATYRLHGRYTKHERHGGKTPASPMPMVISGGPVDGRNGPKSSDLPVLVADGSR